MSTNRDVDRSAVKPLNDRASSCSFTLTDGRQCRTPRRDGHPYLCAFHARKGLGANEPAIFDHVLAEPVCCNNIKTKDL
jgi:hypothetical protein